MKHAPRHSKNITIDMPKSEEKSGPEMKKNDDGYMPEDLIENSIKQSRGFFKDDFTSREFGPEMKKNDDGKLRWDLLPIEPIEEIIRVLMFGATKYEENNWKNGSNNKDIQRTYAAAMRHLTAWKKGEEVAEDSGLLHLSHAACDIIFLIYHALTKK